MSEETLSDLLERAAGKTRVGPAPITEMLNANRRRRRGILAAGTASALVCAIAVGVSATQDSTPPSGDPTPTTPQSPIPVGSIEGSWRLTLASIDGEDVEISKPKVSATLWLNAAMDGRATAGCDVGTVQLKTEADMVRVDVLNVDPMPSCSPRMQDPTGGRYLEALEVVDAAEVTGESLTLTGPETRLQFQRMYQPHVCDLPERFNRSDIECPTTDQSFHDEGEPAIEGTWVVTALTAPNGQSALPDGYADEARMTLEAGQMSGTTSCNTIFGTYVQQGPRGQDLRFPRQQLGSTLVGCPEPPLVERLSDVRHVSAYEQDGDHYLQLHQDNWMIVAVLRPVQELHDN